ncbi:MAG: DUF5011 domain-containing protein, partial [Lachnospira eligens]|nr:DUF5011 domain-containing protein [Lachnospira eligens]
MNNRWVKYLMAGSVTVLMVLVIIFIIRSVKENSLAVSCPDTLVVEYGSTDDEADINETIKKNVLRKKDNKTNIEIEGNVDVTKLGKYDIKIVASRKKKHISRKVAVKVVDTQAPVISLSGDTEITIEAGSNYEEAGFSAVDNYDGDITDKVTRHEKDNVVTYTVSDSSGNKTTVTRTVEYNDGIAPSLTLNGDSHVTIKAGTKY